MIKLTDILNEGRVRLGSEGWTNWRVLQMLASKGLIKKYKSVIKKAYEMPVPDGRYFDRKASDLIYKKVVIPLHKAGKIDPRQVKDFQKDIKKYGEEAYMDAWNDVYKQGVAGSYLAGLAGTIMSGLTQEKYTFAMAGLKEE